MIILCAVGYANQKNIYEFSFSKFNLYFSPKRIYGVTIMSACCAISILNERFIYVSLFFHSRFSILTSLIKSNTYPLFFYTITYYIINYKHNFERSIFSIILIVGLKLQSLNWIGSIISGWSCKVCVLIVKLFSCSFQRIFLQKLWVEVIKSKVNKL